MRFLKLLLLAALALAPQAQALDRLIEVLAAGVTSNTGVVLPLGTVTVYDAGTTNLRTIYSDFALGTPVANPLTLDVAGRAVVYTDKRVKLLIKTAAGATVRTIDNVGTSDADIAASAVTGGIATNVPVGVVLPYAGATAPTGWLFADGTTVSQTTYATLYALVGTTFNTGGESAGTFRLPGTARRVMVGAGGSGTGTLAATVGATGGAETLPAHTHAYSSTSGNSITNLGITTASAGVHTHQPLLKDDTGAGAGFGVQSGAANSQGTSFGNGTTDTAGGHTHTVNTVDAGHTHSVSGTSDSTGTGTHGVMQPSLVLNYIIKY